MYIFVEVSNNKETNKTMKSMKHFNRAKNPLTRLMNYVQKNKKLLTLILY